jgi:hypothetical protein
VKIQSVTTATRLVTSHVTARASVAPDPDLEAVVMTVTVEATEEGAQGRGPTHEAAAEIAAETTADTPDLGLVIATIIMVVTERTATAAAPATLEVAAATEMIAEEILPPKREAPLLTGEAPSSMRATLKSE